MKGYKSYCWKSCEECATFKATLINDEEEKRKLATKWQTEFGVFFKPAEIYCYGCLAQDSKVFKFAKECKIRKQILKLQNARSQRND